MGALTREENTIKVAADFIAEGAGTARIRQHIMAAPLALSSAGCHALINSNAVITTGITNPDFPRNVSIVSGGSGHAAAGTVTVNGTDARNVAISETLTLNGNTKVVGNKAFKTVTSIDMTAVTGNDANDTVSVGYDNKFGLGRKMNDGNSILLATIDNAADSGLGTVAFSTTNICNNTIIPATAPNGTHNYTFTYVTTEKYPNS